MNGFAAAEQMDAVDETGASDGASPLIHVLCGHQWEPRVTEPADVTRRSRTAVCNHEVVAGADGNDISVGRLESHGSKSRIRWCITDVSRP